MAKQKKKKTGKKDKAATPVKPAGRGPKPAAKPSLAAAAPNTGQPNTGQPDTGQPGTVDMQFAKLTIATNTGKLDGEGFSVGDTKPWPIAVEGDAAAQFLRSFSAKAAAAFDAQEATFKVNVDLAAHEMLPDQ